MKTKTWTAFGAGHFINDIQDAIESNGQALKAVVLNMELTAEVLIKYPMLRSLLISINSGLPRTAISLDSPIRTNRIIYRAWPNIISSMLT